MVTMPILQKNAMVATIPIMWLLQIPTIFRRVFRQLVSIVIQPNLVGNLLITVVMISNFRFTQESITVNGTLVPIVIQILQIMLYSVALIATTTATRQMSIASTTE